MSCDFWRDLIHTRSECSLPPALIIGYDGSAYPGGTGLRQGLQTDPFWPNPILRRWSSTWYEYQLYAAAYPPESNTTTPIQVWFTDYTQTLYIDGVVIDRHGFYYGYPTVGDFGVTLDSNGLGVTFYKGHFSSLGSVIPTSMDIELKDSGNNTLFHSTISFSTNLVAVPGSTVRWYISCSVVNIVNKLIVNIGPTEYAATGLIVI